MKINTVNSIQTSFKNNTNQVKPKTSTKYRDRLAETVALASSGLLCSLWAIKDKTADVAKTTAKKSPILDKLIVLLVPVGLISFGISCYKAFKEYQLEKQEKASKN